MRVNERTETSSGAARAFERSPDSLSMNALSVVLMGVNQERRRILSTALARAQARVARAADLPGLDELPHFLECDPDVVIVDLEGDPERALDLVAAACAANNDLT